MAFILPPSLLIRKEILVTLNTCGKYSVVYIFWKFYCWLTILYFTSPKVKLENNIMSESFSILRVLVSHQMVYTFLTDNAEIMFTLIQYSHSRRPMACDSELLVNIRAAKKAVIVRSCRPFITITFLRFMLVTLSSELSISSSLTFLMAFLYWSL